MEDFPRRIAHLGDFPITSSIQYRDWINNAAHSFQSAVQSVQQGIVEGNKRAERAINTIGTQTNADLGRLSRGIEAGFGDLSGEIRRGFDSQAAVLYRVAGSLSRLDEKFNEVIRLLKRPRKNLAYEAFDDAREQFNNGHFTAALRSIGWAIKGDGLSHTGYETEFLFHFLLGKIRLGNWLDKRPNVSPDVVNPELAEKAFLDAVEYHLPTAPIELKSEAFICAGRAALVQRKVDEAIIYTRSGLALCSNHITGHYQLARLLCAAHQDDEAKAQLLHVFDMDLSLIEMAEVDEDFRNRRHIFEWARSAKTAQLSQEYGELLTQYERSFCKIRNFTFDGLSAQSVLHTDIEKLDDTIKVARQTATNGGPLELDAAIKVLANNPPRLDAWWASFKTRFAIQSKDKYNCMEVAVLAREANAQAAQHRENLRKANSEYEALKSRSDMSIRRLGFGLLMAVLSWQFAVNVLIPAAIVDDKVWGFFFIFFVMLVTPAVLLLWPALRAPFELASPRARRRAAKNEAEPSEKMAKRLQMAADKAWEPFQASIDRLSRTEAPF